MNCSPSPLPVPSQDADLKNSRVSTVLGVDESVTPRLPLALALVTNG